MAKRKTKEQRDEEAKAMLRQRMCDLFTGATGDCWSEEDDAEPWPKEFIAFCQATQRVFKEDPKPDEPYGGNAYLWNLWNLDNFRTPETATDFLFANGVRA